MHYAMRQEAHQRRGPRGGRLREEGPRNTIKETPKPVGVLHSQRLRVSRGNRCATSALQRTAGLRPRPRPQDIPGAGAGDRNVLAKQLLRRSNPSNPHETRVSQSGLNGRKPCLPCHLNSSLTPVPLRARGTTRMSCPTPCTIHSNRWRGTREITCVPVQTGGLQPKHTQKYRQHSACIQGATYRTMVAPPVYLPNTIVSHGKVQIAQAFMCCLSSDSRILLISSSRSYPNLFICSKPDKHSSHWMHVSLKWKSKSAFSDGFQLFLFGTPNTVTTPNQNIVLDIAL